MQILLGLGSSRRLNLHLRASQSRVFFPVSNPLKRTQSLRSDWSCLTLLLMQKAVTVESLGAISNHW